MDFSGLLVALSVVTAVDVVRADTSTAGSSIWLGLTVSSLITTKPPRQLEVSWWCDQVLPGDMVALFAADPSIVATASLVAHNVSANQGHFRTGLQTPVIPFAKLGFSTRCLGYWAAYVRAGSAVASKCLRTRPTWMSDYRGEIGALRLRNMFLPGTHDSAAYKVFGGEDRDTLVTRNAITQEEDVMSQLIHGVRYLDLRVGHYKLVPGVWWANHGVVRLHSLRDIFAQIKTFLQNTDEIVILDIQEFNPGFGKNLDIHLKLVQFLVTELSQFMALPSLTWDARLEDVWQSGQRLIVTYDHLQVVMLSTLLWPAVEHRWGNVQSLGGLHDYLRNVVARPPPFSPWAAMAELTPTTWLIVTNKMGGLREMADLVNRNVTEWFRGPWGGVANVVAVDFFRGTEIVEEAIAWNRRRAREDMFHRHRRPSPTGLER